MPITLSGSSGISSPGFTPTGNTSPVSGINLLSSNTISLVTSSTDRVKINPKGIITIGDVQPSNWADGYRALELGSASAVSYLAFNNGTFPQGYIYWNSYYNGANNLYKTTNLAGVFGYNSDGKFIWYTAPSGTANTTISGFNSPVMTLDNSGRLNVSNQVCFHVSNTTQPSSTSFTNDFTLLRFEVTNLNVGGGWNSSTYRFTAPVTGRYYVYGQTRFDSVSTYSRLMVIKNGDQTPWNPGIHNISPTPTNSTWSYWSHSVSGVLQLSAGDYIELRGGSQNGSGTHQGEGSFGGYLLG